MAQSNSVNIASTPQICYVDALADEPENLTLRLLQEMRDEAREARNEAREAAKDLTNRINGLTVLLTMLAGMVHDHEERLVKVENG